jgi:hypothetical protein
MDTAAGSLEKLIEPRETRARAIRALRVLVNKVGTIARMNHAGIPV